MPTFPGTQLMSGAGTQVLLPDGFVISLGAISDYSISGAAITFTNTTGVAHTYTAPSDGYAQLVMAALTALPDKAASFYAITSLLPTYAVLSLSAITGSHVGGDTITATGVGFVDGLVANLGGTVAAVTFISSTSFSFITPPGTLVGAGAPVNLTVRNPDGTETVLTNAFTYT